MTGEELYYEIFSELMADDVFYEFLENPKGKMSWRQIPKYEYIKALNEFVKFNKLIHFPSDVIYTWMSKICYDVVKLDRCTELSGHSQYFEAPFLNDYRWVIDEDINNVDEFLAHRHEHPSTDNDENDVSFDVGGEILYRIGFYDWAELPDGTDGISDFGIKPMCEIIAEYNSDLSPEKVLILINRILDVSHQRGDLASMFIDGGTKTLSQISQTENRRRKIVLNESQLKTFLTEMTKKEINDMCKNIDKNPSEKQKEAGNYKKAHITVNGFKITIENPKGGFRSGVSDDGKKWETKMNNHYGYFNTTEGKDGDHIDVFVGDDLESDKIFVVDQNNKNGDFDEHKVMLGFDKISDAKKAYLSNYEKGWTGFGDITEINIDDFKGWLYADKKRIKAFKEYKTINEGNISGLKPGGVYLGQRGGTLQFISSNSPTIKGYDTLVGTINRINAKTLDKVPKNALSSLVASDNLQRGIKVLPNGTQIGLYNVNEIAGIIIAKNTDGSLMRDGSGKYILNDDFKKLIKYYNK